ncbi:unnamed protein product [Phytomonas sp. EM1]|nr:unnamed protein product [Phytomonas sp. EM1]|eukprot:CCW62393.1 unnamed protein product [Phytomonas sp. isolate EM1]
MITDIADESSGTLQLGKNKSQSFFVEFLVESFFVQPSNLFPPFSLLNPTLHLDGLNTLVPSIAQRVGNLCHELSLLPDRCIQIGPPFKIITKPIKIIASLAYLTYLVVFKHTSLELGPALFDKWFGFCVGKQNEMISKSWLIAQVYVKKLPKAGSVLLNMLEPLNKNTFDRSLLRISNEYLQFCSPCQRSFYQTNFLFVAFQTALSSLCSLSSGILFSFEKSFELFDDSFLDSKKMLHNLQRIAFHCNNADELGGNKFYFENLLACTSSEAIGVCFFLALKQRCGNLFKAPFWSFEAIIKSSNIMSLLYRDVLTYFCIYSIGRRRSLRLLDALSFFLFGKINFCFDNTFYNNLLDPKEPPKYTRRSYSSKVLIKSSTTVNCSTPISSETKTHGKQEITSPLKFSECDFRCFNEPCTLNSAVKLLSSAYDVSDISDKINDCENNDILNNILEKTPDNDFPVNGVELAIPTRGDDTDIDLYLRSCSEFDKMNRVFYAMSE